MARCGYCHRVDKFRSNIDLALHPGERNKAGQRAPEDLAVLRRRRNDGRRVPPPSAASLDG